MDVEFVLTCNEMLKKLLKWHLNNILKVDVFNCFVVLASVCTKSDIIEERIYENGLSEFSSEIRIKCVCV